MLRLLAEYGHHHHGERVCAPFLFVSTCQFDSQFLHHHQMLGHIHFLSKIFLLHMISWTHPRYMVVVVDKGVILIWIILDNTSALI